MSSENKITWVIQGLHQHFEVTLQRSTLIPCETFLHLASSPSFRMLDHFWLYIYIYIYIYKIYVYSQKGPTNRLGFYVSGTHLARSKFDQSVKFEASWPKATYLFVKMAPRHVLLCVWSVCCFAVSSLRTPGFSGVAGHRSDLFQTWDRYGGPPNGVWWFIKLSLLRCYGWYNMYNYN